MRFTQSQSFSRHEKYSNLPEVIIKFISKQAVIKGHSVHVCTTKTEYCTVAIQFRCLDQFIRCRHIHLFSVNYVCTHICTYVQIHKKNYLIVSAKAENVVEINGE